MLSGSLSVEFFVYIHDVILFNVQLRNKYDDDVPGGFEVAVDSELSSRRVMHDRKHIN